MQDAHGEIAAILLQYFNKFFLPSKFTATVYKAIFRPAGFREV